MADSKTRRCTFCFFFLLLIDILDLVCDWLFFYDVYVIEKGLVFGPHEPMLVWAVLAFTIVGTVDFPLQVYVTAQDSMNDNPEPKLETRLDVMNLILFVIEDIPQAVLLLLVSLCREDPSSIWSVTKASFVLLTSLIKVVPNISACCKNFTTLKTLLVVGAFIELFIGVLVFFLTQMELTETGGLHFNKPTTIVDERFNDNLYLSDVSLFIHDPNFLAKISDKTPSKSSELKWIRLDYLRHIQRDGHEIVRVDYERSEYHDDVIKVRVWEKDGDGLSSNHWLVHGCYTVSTTTGNVEMINPVYLSCTFSEEKSSSLYLTFQYIKPAGIFKKHIMGDIIFNAKYRPPGGKPELIHTIQKMPVFSTNATIEDNKYVKHDFFGAKIRTPILLHYFRHQPVPVTSVTRGHHENNNVLVTVKDGKIKGHLYMNEKTELIDVKDIWKTGWSRCPTTGNQGPRFDAGVEVVT